MAEYKVRNPQFEIRDLAASLPVRLLALIFCSVLIAVAPAQTPDEQQPIERKLPSVRCTFAPTMATVRWQTTPGTPTTPSAPGTEVEISTPRVESQIPNSGSPLPVLNPPSPDTKRQLVRQSLGDVGTPNGNNNCGISNPQSEVRNPKFSSAERQTPNAERGTSTDAWFQIPTETPEPTDIQEAFLTTSPGDSDKAAQQPLAQVLANLARRAQRNFVDPGIPSNETITCNFADSDVDPWEAFTLIAQTRGYRIVNRDNIVTLARNEQDPLNPVNPRTVKAEVWIWLDQSAKPRADLPGLAIQLADTHVAPNRKPQTVRSLEPGSNAQISLIDAQSERGDSILRLTVNPVLLPNGNIEAGLGIENAAPSLDGHKGVTIRRTINHTVELTPMKQVIEIDGILMPSGDPDAGKQTWIQRLFRKKKPEKDAPARMVVKLTIEPTAGSETPIPTDSPVHMPKSDSGKTGIALAPRQNRRSPELTSIQTVKH